MGVLLDNKHLVLRLPPLQQKTQEQAGRTGADDRSSYGRNAKQQRVDSLLWPHPFSAGGRHLNPANVLPEKFEHSGTRCHAHQQH